MEVLLPAVDTKPTGAIATYGHLSMDTFTGLEACDSLRYNVLNGPNQKWCRKF